MKTFSTLTLIFSLFAITSYSQTGINDNSFSTGTGPNFGVISACALSTGKTLIGGGFIAYNGANAYRIALVNTDGTLDNTFAGITNNSVYKVKESSTGKIYVSGQFTTFNGITAGRIARLNADGTKDAGFGTSPGANGFVYSLDEQSDGKIILAGGFATFGGVSRARIARATTSGANDATFSIGTGFNNTVYTVKIQSDGKILVGGLFTTYNGQSSPRIVRLNSDGSVDNTFNMGSGITHTGTLTAVVYDINLQSDGKILVAGNFGFYNGNPVSNLVRLNSDGTIDNTFTNNTFQSTIRSTVQQVDGKILAVGQYTTVNGVSKNRIVRLTTSGAVDNTFGGSGANGDILTSSLQADGNLILGGNFSTYSGTTRNYLARVLMTCSTVTLTSNSVNNICFGGATGAATINAVGGLSFTYSWSPNISITSTASNLTAGNYTCNVTNECGNISTTTLTITQPAQLNVAVSGSSLICSGSEATLTATGANTYTWSTTETTSIINPTPTVQTTYTVTGSDLNGCTNTAVRTISISGVCATAIMPCGVTVNNLNYPAYASVVPSSTSYRFKFYNMSNVLVATKVNPTRLVVLNSVNGIYYNNSYKWTVAVNQGFGFGPESTLNCTLNINPPALTVPCSKTITSLSTPVLSSSADNLISYRVTFYNNATNTLVATKTFSTNYLYLNQVPGLGYGNTYKYTIEAEYFNGISNVFSSPSTSLCTITVAAPQAKLPCGNTYTNSAAYTAVTAISGVSAYRVNFYAQATGSLIATKTFTSNYIYLNQVPGLIFNKSYFWTIECEYNNGSGNVFGPASSNTCTMVYGQPLSIVINNSGENANSTLRTVNNSDNTLFYMNLYPNPTKDLVNIDTDANIREVVVKNVTGQQLSIPIINNSMDLTMYDNGVYFISIITDKGNQNFRIIKQN